MTEPPAWTPLVVNCRGSVSDALQARRKQLGLTLADLDHKAGVADRYSGKLLRGQSPQGRAGVHFADVCTRTPAGDITLSGAAEFITEALGLRLLVVDAETAERIGAVPAPRHVQGRASAHHSAKRSEGARRMSAGQWEAAHGAKVAGDLLRTSVIDHPYVAEHPVLLEEARAIDALIADLYARIRAAE
jgi:hypothetical protein